MKNLKKRIIRYFAQIYADTLVRRMQTELDLEDHNQFYFLYEQATKLNAYCIVFHNIYLD